MLIHAVPLSQLNTDVDLWADRRRRYDAQARRDFELYDWLEQQGRLPQPGNVPSAADELDFIECTRPNRIEVGRMSGTRRNGAVKVSKGFFETRVSVADGDEVGETGCSVITPTFISLFAGVGGFDLGFERAGMKCAAQVEKDKAAHGVLAHHWPGVHRLADIHDVGRHNLPGCDVVCGGFPCQDLSVAGNRAGLAGARSGLFYEMTRICDELRPSFICWENVPGLLSSDDGRDFARVLMELERIGYSGCWTTLDAQFFGVAQRRRRIFGVFARQDIGAGCCAEILSFATRMRWHHTPSRDERPAVATTLTAGIGSGGRPSGRRQEDDFNIVLAGTQSPGKHQMRAGNSVRRLTPRECERLQGFPDDWTRWATDKHGQTCEQPDSPRYRQLGNAVAVPCAEWIGRRIVAVMAAMTTPEVRP